MRHAGYDSCECVSYPLVGNMQTANLSNPKNRKTVQVVQENHSGLQQDLSVVTYNILADFYLQSALAKGRYRHCPRHYVTPHNSRENPRHKLLITEVCFNL